MGGGREGLEGRGSSVCPDLWCIQILVYNWHSIMVFFLGGSTPKFSHYIRMVLSQFDTCFLFNF